MKSIRSPHRKRRAHWRRPRAMSRGFGRRLREVPERGVAHPPPHSASRLERAMKRASMARSCAKSWARLSRPWRTYSSPFQRTPTQSASLTNSCARSHSLSAVSRSPRSSDARIRSRSRSRTCETRFSSGIRTSGWVDGHCERRTSRISACRNCARSRACVASRAPSEQSCAATLQAASAASSAGAAARQVFRARRSARASRRQWRRGGE